MISTLERIEANEQAVLESAFVRGQIKGQEMQVIEIAKRMIRRKKPLEDISEDIGLSITTLQKLKEEIERE